MYNFVMPITLQFSAAPLTALMFFVLTLMCSSATAADAVRNASAEQRVSDAKMARDASGGENAEDRQQRPTFGWIEKVILSPELRWKLDAKLDTGADTSSLDASGMRRVRYKGKSYVRFSVRDPESGDMVSLRRPYVRTVRIRRHNGEHQRRRVVLMTVCLGSEQRTIEVTLTGREVFDYPMLLGRSALAGLAVVDPMQTYTTAPECKQMIEDDVDDGASESSANTLTDVGVTRDTQ